MSLIKCPECNKEISDKATACPNCGFPIQDKHLNSQASSTAKTSICPKCGFIYISECKKCKTCGIKLIDTDIAFDDYEKMDITEQWNFTQELYNKYVINSPEFDETLFKKVYDTEQGIYNYKMRKAQSSTPKITCPYCNSTNTKKISSMAKATNIALFGIFGNKRKYQWHCNNCNSDF